MPLSEEEQRILHEMEQKLYENDRAFVDRVRAEGPHSYASRSLRWSILSMVGGFALLILSFRSSLLLGTAGFLVMLFSAFLVERSARQVRGTRPEPMPGPAGPGETAGHARAESHGSGGSTGTLTSPRRRALADELALIGSRLRSRMRRRS